MTNLYYSKEGREKLLRGVNQVADAVKVTLGAKGRNVSISMGPGNVPLITKDGVTVAQSVKQLADPIEDMGAQLVKAAARKTMALVGDGTTTSTLLVQAIVTLGMELIETKAANPMDIKKGIDKAVTAVVANLKSMATKIYIAENPALLQHIATISANNDIEMGRLIASVILAVGADGIVSVDESKAPETSFKLIEAMQIERGLFRAEFVNNQEKMTAEFDNPYILIYDKKISMLADISNLLERVVATGKPLVVIAEEVDGEALHVMIATKVQKGYPFAAIRAPFGGVEVLEDIAVATGGTVISESRGHTLSTIPLTELGTAKRIVISQNDTFITDGNGDSEAIKQRAANLRRQIEDCTNEFEKPYLRKRLAKLTKGVAVIYAGGHTDVEMKEKKDRIDDSVRATLAAIEEGIVPGGGIAYLNCLDFLEKISLENRDEELGAKIIYEALTAPLEQICINAGKSFDGILIDINNHRGTQINSTTSQIGYNAKTDKIEDLFEAGVIDPAKVSRVALENSASVASMLMTTECAIADV